MSVVKVTNLNFEEVINTEKTVLLDFYADWCGPCRMVAPIIEEIANENSDITVGKINVDEEQSLAMKFGVTSIPMLAVIKNGQVVKTAMGARPKAAVLDLLK